MPIDGVEVSDRALECGRLDKDVALADAEYPGSNDRLDRLMELRQIAFGWHFTERNRVSLYFEHVSNGLTRDRNEGLDNLGILLSHRF